MKANVLISSPGSSMTRLSPNRVDNNNVNNLSEGMICNRARILKLYDEVPFSYKFKKLQNLIHSFSLLF